MAFLKINKREYKDKTYKYGLIVESVREGGQSTHRVLKNLGRLKTDEDFQRARELEELYKQGEQILRLDEISIQKTRDFGLIYAIQHLWDDHGIRTILEEIFEGRRTTFDPAEITRLLTTAHFFGETSEHAAYCWIRDDAFPLYEPDLQHLYRTLDLLYEHKDEIERRLFEELDCWDQIETVFYDLTSTYFEGEGPRMAEFGYSRDNRSDREQVVIGVATANGKPITHHVWPGSTADSSTLEHVLTDLRDRFAIDDATFIADRGLITPDNLDELNEKGWKYILATNRRGDDEIAEMITQDVPGDSDQRARVVEEDGDQRYILCLNTDRRDRDLEKLKADCAEMKGDLEELVERYDDSQTGRGRPMTKGGVEKRATDIIKRGLYTVDVDEEANDVTFELDAEKHQYEQAICGKFLLVTNTDFEPKTVMTAYRELRDIEWCFRQLKQDAEIRPVNHHKDRRVEAHIFLAILTVLTRRLLVPETYSSDDLDALKDVKVHRIDANGEEVWMRNELGSATDVLSRLDIEEPTKFRRP